MQGAFFRTFPVSRFSQTEYASDIWQSERRMNVITFFRETMWFSRGNYVTLFILYTNIFLQALQTFGVIAPNYYFCKKMISICVTLQME